MDHLEIGADDYRILTYARLIDSDVWPVDQDPEVTPLTSHRLKLSLEAAYRIACHEGGVADPTDVVGRLSDALGISVGSPPIELPAGMDHERLSSFAALLMGEGHEDDAAEQSGTSLGGGVFEARAEDTESNQASEDDATTHVARDEVESGELDAIADSVSGAGIDLDVEDDPDPDHDPEKGISHVGDADEGQYHEEHRP